MPHKGWHRAFDDPIPLPGSSELHTLRDAATYITKLPKREHETLAWRTAIQASMLVADQGGDTMQARIGIVRALYPKRGATSYDLRPRKGSFTLVYGRRELAIIGGSRVRPPLLGAKRRWPMGVAGWRFAHMKRTHRVRAVVVGVLEELPFICPVVVAIGSLIMITITLCNDWPQ